MTAFCKRKEYLIQTIDYYGNIDNIGDFLNRCINVLNDNELMIDNIYIIKYGKLIAELNK